jgi:DnaJ-class molecular chaperone
MSKFHAIFGLMPWPYASAHKTEICASADKVECPACHGHGISRGPQKGMPWFDCRYCGGAGEVTEQQSLDYPPRP